MNYYIISKLFIFAIIFSLSIIRCDLPVHCKREEIDGLWTFRINKEVFQPSLDNPKTTCGHGFPDKIETTVGDHEFTFETYTDIKIKLSSNYKVYENEKEVGVWTPIYDEGFILKYKQAVFTAFMKYYKEYSSSKVYISNCNKTMIGWYIPDENQKDKNWSCFFGIKHKTKNVNFLHKENVSSNQNIKSIFSIYENRQIPEVNMDDIYFMSIKEKVELQSKSKSRITEKINNVKYEDQHEIVDEINKMNLTWKASVHQEFVGLSLLQVREKLGLHRKKPSSFYESNKKFNKFKKSFKKSNLKRRNKEDASINIDQPNFMQINDKSETIRELDGKYMNNINDVQKYLTTDIKDINEDSLPLNWDWRNISGKNFVPKLRRQENCGSCYIFSTISSLESRLRVLTDNEDETEFSRQFPLSCSFYTEGCDGGYPMLVGKFFHEFELVPEDCFEYEAKHIPCSQVCNYKNFKKKYTVSKYEYIGGFYGATSEVDMMKEIRARGPIPGNMSVPWSFSYYSNGIYANVPLKQNAGTLSKTTLFDKKISWEKVDHSILIIGWGEENNVKYWICMNTWGPDWGEKGFFRLLRGENEVGIETMGDSFQIKVEDR